MAKSTFMWLIAACLIVASHAEEMVDEDFNDPESETGRDASTDEYWDVEPISGKAHTGSFSTPASKTIKLNAQKCIKEWKDNSARGIQNAKTVINCATGIRIDMQGSEHHTNAKKEKVRFERYAVQYQSHTFAVVHLQEGVAFGKKAIKDAFLESMKHKAHIFFTNGLFTKIESYERKRYPRSGFHDTWVHTSHSTMSSICKDVSCDKKSS